MAWFGSFVARPGAVVLVVWQLALRLATAGGCVVGSLACSAQSERDRPQARFCGGFGFSSVSLLRLVRCSSGDDGSAVGRQREERVRASTSLSREGPSRARLCSSGEARVTKSISSFVGSCFKEVVTFK